MRDRQLNILIVEDEEKMRQELKMLLEENNFKVDTAADGEEGLEKLSTNKFDAAVVDLRMPKMGGLEMIRKADEAEVDTYVIILTGHGDKNDAVNALNDLQSMVKYWVDKSSLNDEEFVQRVRRVAEGVPLEEVSRLLSKLPATI